MEKSFYIRCNFKFIWLGNGAAATNADFDLGRINFCNGATITSQIAGSTQTGNNDDGRITLSTKETGGGNNLTERLRIDSSGHVLIGITASTANDSYLQAFKPTGNDSTITVGNVATSASGLSRIDFAPSNSVIGARIECHATEDFSTVAKRTADLVFVTRKDGTHSEKLRIDSTGDVRFAGTNLTDSTNKSVNLTAPSYDTDEEDVNLVQVENESAFNQISFGGGTSGLNAATKLRFLTASDVNTTSGTERMRITSEGWVEHGKRFSGSSTIDTGIYVGNNNNYGAAVFQVIVAGNPNHWGSGSYSACSTYILSFGVGWTGAATSTRFRADRIGYGDGGSGNTQEVTATFHLYDATTSTETSSGTAVNGNNQLRIKIVGSSSASYCKCYIKLLSSHHYLN